NEVGLEEKSGKGEDLFVRVSGAHGETLFLNDAKRWKDLDLKQGEYVQSGSEQPIQAGTRDRRDGLEIESIALPDGNILQVGQSTEEQEALLETFREVFAGFTIPVVILGIAGGSFLAFRALRPVRSLIQTIRTVSTGKMDARVPTAHSGDELDDLVSL